jgi:hypothetical protein
LTGAVSSDAAAIPSSDVQFSSVLVKTGVRLKYAYKGDPSGTPVIMLHGFTDSWFSCEGYTEIHQPGWTI